MEFSGRGNPNDVRERAAAIYPELPALFMGKSGLRRFFGKPLRCRRQKVRLLPATSFRSHASWRLPALSMIHGKKSPAALFRTAPALPPAKGATFAGYVVS